MKKNNVMRFACALLVLTLLSTCVISGTFAKYVTMDNAGDSARVAKFGVVVTADGSLFGETYIKADNNKPGTGDITVDAHDDANVVAPGTKNGDETIEFSITGKPEVDVRIDVNVTDADEDVFLKAGSYMDVTTGDDDDTFNFADDYYPVKYTLTQTKTTTGAVAEKLVTNGTLAQLKAALEGITTAEVAADKDKDLGETFGNYVITWEWAYGNDDGDTNEYTDIAENDKKDTVLGDLAAAADSVKDANGDALEVGMDKDYNLNTGFNFTVAVTQVD